MKNILSPIFLQLFFGTLLIAQSVLRPNIQPEQGDTTISEAADNILEVPIVQFNKQFED